jgi:hypothetical protein
MNIYFIGSIYNISRVVSSELIVDSITVHFASICNKYTRVIGIIGYSVHEQV